MNLREHLQAGTGRGILTVILPVAILFASWHWWPTDSHDEETLLGGIQKIAFVAAAFAVTAYNLRTRVVDLVLKVEGAPSRVDEFCRIARSCGQRLTNLVVLFTVTAAWLGGVTMLHAGSMAAKLAGVGALALFAASIVSFLYILFSFERLERFALDEAEKNARAKESARLFKTADS